MQTQDLKTLIGKIAITDSDLSPKGTAVIDDEVYEVEAEEGYVEAGRGVRVTRVKGKKIFIRRV
jgi:membrane-bound serine protease (ClpP class)